MELAGNLVPADPNPNLPFGTICVASGELARYPSFCDSLVHVLKPKGTSVEWSCGLHVAANFNACIRRMVGEWVWILGDDHEFEPTALIRLLEHDLDVVVPLCVRRQPPFIPVLFKEAKDDTPEGQFPPHYWHQLPAHGLHEVYTAGSAGMLIRKRVLDAIGDPWFEMGQMGRDLANEDTHFCQKVQKAGFKIYADTDVQLGHWTPMALWPARLESGAWTVGIDMGQNVKIVLPPQSLEVLAGTIKGEAKGRQ